MEAELPATICALILCSLLFGRRVASSLETLPLLFLCHDGLWSRTMDQKNLCLPEIALVRMFYHSNWDKSLRCGLKPICIFEWNKGTEYRQINPSLVRAISREHSADRKEPKLLRGSARVSSSWRQVINYGRSWLNCAREFCFLVLFFF